MLNNINIFKQTFEKLLGEGKLSERSLSYLKKIHSSTNRFRSFTPLQENAFSNDDFWNFQKHLMICGATSSGKTLVAEIAMLQSIDRGKNTIYLSPLRSMVSEKFRTFLRHFDDCGKICASDKDHQNDDYYIVEGEAKISVVVYEKFFAFLAQGNAKKMLEKCDIIVFDEIQMIANEERGIKIIMSLLNILAQKPSIRLVFMTTSYSDMTSVIALMQNKLKMDIFQIFDDRNSMALEELVLYRTGQIRGKYSPSLAERQMDEESFKARLAEKGEELSTHEDDIRALKTHIHWKQDITNLEDRKELKRRMLDEIIKENREKKIIVFINSRKLCRDFAEHIAKDTSIFSKTILKEELLTKLNNLSATRIRDVLINDLMPFGVAYHHGGLSQAYRDIIEDEFYNGCLNVLFATETLAIGVNLPADVIVVYDTQRRNENDETINIDAQTYKNYIGRAGRLGVANDATPRSYLLALEPGEMQNYWSNYVCTKPTKILPAYEAMKFDEILPYFLSMLSNGKYNEDQLEEKLGTHFPNLGGQEFFKTLLNVNADKPRKQWVKGEVADDKFIPSWDSMVLMDRVEDDDFEFGEEAVSYQLSHFGIKVIQYALSIFSYYKIWIFFVKNDSNENKKRNIVLKERLFGDFSEEKSTISVLHAICKFREIERFRKLNAVSFQKNSNLYYRQKDALIAYFEKLAAQGEIPEGSDLRKDYSDMKEQREKDGVMTALWRTFVFYLWMQEKTLEEIEREIGINLPDDFEEGDMERLADVAGFLIEAISDAVSSSPIKEIRNSSMGFRKLSSRIHYGGSDDVVKILNCHVYGLSRDAVLKLKQSLIQQDIAQKNVFCYFNDEYNDDMTYASVNISEEQRTELRETLKKRYQDGKIQKIMYTMRGEGLLFEGLEECLEEQELKLRRVEDFLMRTSTYGKMPYLAEKINNYYRLSSGYQRLYCVISTVDQPSEVVNKFNDSIKQNPGRWIVVLDKSVFLHARFDTMYRHFETQIPESDVSFYTPEAFLRLYLQCLTYTNVVYNPFIYNLCENKGKFSQSMPSFKLPKLLVPTKDQFDVFISYSNHANNDLPQELYSQLLERGKNVFLDIESIHKGDNFVERIICGLLESGCFICLLNKEYMSGKWTNTELTAIFRRCVESNIRAIFVALDDDGFQIIDNPIVGVHSVIDGRGKNRVDLIRKIMVSINE